MSFILDMAAGFAVALLCGMGVGGGGLLIVYLTLAAGFGQIEAQGINYIFYICAAIASLILHIRHGRIKFKILIYISLCGSVGAVAGSICAVYANPDFIRKAFGVCLLSAGIITLRRS